MKHKLFITSTVSFLIFTFLSISQIYADQNPVRSAVYLEVQLETKLCVSDKEQRKVICFDKTLKSSGSGVIVKKTSTGSYILSAAHVCLAEKGLPAFVNISKKTLISKDTFDETYKTEILIFDEANDLCLLFAENLLSAPVVKLSKEPPKIGNRVYSIGYPAGMHERNLIHKFTGFFSGYKEVNGTIKSIYSVYSQPGSSGGMLVNENGELIGITQMINTKMPFYTISSTHLTLKWFVEVSCKKYLGE